MPGGGNKRLFVSLGKEDVHVAVVQILCEGNDVGWKLKGLTRYGSEVV